MSTIYRWSGSADGTWTTTVGTAPTVAVGGTYGERWVWPATTAQAFGSHTGLNLADHGVRIIYTVAAFNSGGGSHMVLMGMGGGTPAVMQWKLNLTGAGNLRILDAASANVGQSTAALTAGVEYRIECYRVGATLTARAYTLAGVLVASASGTVASTTITNIQFGNNASPSGTLGSFTIDEVVITDVGAEVGPVTPITTTYYEWHGSSDGTFNTVVGTAPTVVAGGSYGERWEWPTTTAASYGGVTLASIGDFGCRFIYSIDAWPTAGTHSVLQGQATAGAQQFKVDISVGRLLNLRPTGSTPIVAGTVPLSVGTEYRFEVHRSGANLTVKVYSGEGTTLIDSVTHTAVGTAALTRMAFGNNSTPTAGATIGSYTIDEIVIIDQPVDVGPATPSTPTVSAPADFSTEPWEPFTLTATSTAPSCVWSQVSGTLTAAPVNSGTLVGRVTAAPPSLDGATLTYRATVTGGDFDDVTVTVLPATDAVYTGSGGPETMAWVPVRLVTPSTTPPAGLAADWVSDFRSRIGFCAGMKDTPYVDDPTTALNTMLGYISPTPGSDIGVMRIGRVVAANTTTRTAQRAAAVIAKARGIKLLGMLDDYGTDTPATRLTEALGNWQGQLLALLGRNEVQRYWSMAEWPDAGLLDVDSVEEMCSKENVIAEMERLKAARDAQSPTLPICVPSMASKGVYTWYSALQDYAVSAGKSVKTLSEWIELHDYPGGWEPSNANGTRKTREAAEAAYGVNRTTILSETGYEDTGTQAVPEDVAAVYYPRLWFENIYDNGYEYVLAFQLCNTDSTRYGIFYSGLEAGKTLYQPKQAADSVRNLLALYADTATTYTPAPLPATVSAPTGLSWKLHQRSDGKWLLAVWQPGARVWNPGTQTVVTPTTKTFTVSTPTTRTFARHVPRLASTPQATTTGTTCTVDVGADLVVLLIT